MLVDMLEDHCSDISLSDCLHPCPGKRLMAGSGINPGMLLNIQTEGD